MKFPALNWIKAGIAGILILYGRGFAVTDVAVTASKERRLPAELASVLCSREINASDLAKNGIFDAQIEVVSLRPKSQGQRISDVLLRERAAQVGRSNGNRGYSIVSCDDGGGRILSFPSAAQIAVLDEHIVMPARIMAECVESSLRVLFAPEKRGRSLLIPNFKSEQGALRARLPAQRGYASVSCVFKGASNDGSRELALVPVAGASVDPATLSGLKMADGVHELLAWVNQKRAGEALAPLVVNEELSSAGKILLGNVSIAHNQAALAKTGLALKNRGIDALGENRAGASNVAELAGLLWMSPSHRDLLLNPTADIIGVATASKENGIFVSMVIGRKVPVGVAKNIHK